MFKFLIPFRYLFYSRLPKKSEIISLFYIYPLYLAFFLFVLYGPSGREELLGFGLLFIAWMLIYEIGYLENDTITIKKERHPNLRIPERDILTIQRFFWPILVLRVVSSLMVILLVYFLQILDFQTLSLFLLCLAAARLIFWIHNSVRSRINILTYFLLCCTKYFVFPLIFLRLGQGIEPYLIVLVSFPILRTLEHARKPKYDNRRVERFVGDLDEFRFRYYGCLLLITFFLNSIGLLSAMWFWSIGYFFVFRLSIYLLIKKGIYVRSLGATKDSSC